VSPQLFPSHNSGRRRVIRALRPWVSRIMPRKKTEAMQSLVRVLPPDEKYNFSPFGWPNQSRRKSTSNVGEDEGFCDAKETEEGLHEAEELKNEEPQGGRPRRFSVFHRRDLHRMRGGNPHEYAPPDERLVYLELPGPEERLHEVEQTMKLMVAELHYLRQRTNASPTRTRPPFDSQPSQTSEQEAAESRASEAQLQRYRSLPNSSP
jgi:hypothetical protein